MPKSMLYSGLLAIFLLVGGTAASAQEKEPEIIPLIAVDSYATTALWTFSLMTPC